MLAFGGNIFWAPYISVSLTARPHKHTRTHTQIAAKFGGQKKPVKKKIFGKQKKKGGKGKGKGKPKAQVTDTSKTGPRRGQGRMM